MINVDKVQTLLSEAKVEIQVYKEAMAFDDDEDMIEETIRDLICNLADEIQINLNITGVR